MPATSPQSSSQWPLSAKDRDLLRNLAGRYRAWADEPVMAERVAAWKQHNMLQGGRPMVLAEAGGCRQDIMTQDDLCCEADWARGLEMAMRMALWQAESVKDDSVLMPYWAIGWNIQRSDYGVSKQDHHADNDGNLGARSWDAGLQDLHEDFHKLKPRGFSVDRQGTLAWKAFLEDLFDGIMPVKIRCGYSGWTMGLTWTAIDLVGLQNLMLYMYDEPDDLHRLMAFLRDDHLAYLDWLEAEDLLTLNNENEYVGSGGRGFTDELPRSNRDQVTTHDLWVLSESQETVGVGPEQFAEFIFPYQLDIVKRFGLTYYGCCEPVHSRWHVLKRMPNLRTVSISPWCDQEKMAADMGQDYIFARKPNPTLISTNNFDEAAIRQDLRQTLAVAGECHLELVMKDVHTLKGDASRLGRWVALAREEIARYAG